MILVCRGEIIRPVLRHWANKLAPTLNYSESPIIAT